MYQSHFKKGIIRILDPQGQALGGGLLVHPGCAVTCAHVIRQANGSSDLPSAAVWIDFPFLPEIGKCQAALLSYQPEKDIAILRPEPPVDLPAAPLRLIRYDEWLNHHFVVYGFPRGHGEGVWAGGVLREINAAGHIQGQAEHVQGYAVTGGFSGSPVWDEQIGGICGIVNRAEKSVDRRTFTLIPSGLLVSAWPELKDSTLDFPSRGYWEEQLAGLRQSVVESAHPSLILQRIAEIEALLAHWGQSQSGPEDLEKWYQQDLAGERAAQTVPVRGSFPSEVNLRIFKDRLPQFNQALNSLADPSCGMVALFGFSGYGKTALAAKIIERLRQPGGPEQSSAYHPDGIIILSAPSQVSFLEAVFDGAAGLFQDIAGMEIQRIWANPRRSAADKAVDLQQALQGRILLICLDNLETLLDEQGHFLDHDLQALIETCLAGNGQIKFLATTRQQMLLDPNLNRLIDFIDLREGLPAEDALSLLYEYDRQGDFQLHDLGENQLATILEQVKRSPQAIKYLINLLSSDDGLLSTFDEIAAQANQSEDMVYALAEVNYRRLDWRARKVVEALAVFQSPVPVDAVDYLLAAVDPEFHAAASIPRLVNSFLIEKNRERKTISLHPSLREYTYRQIPAQGDYSQSTLEQRAARYYSEKARLEPSGWRAGSDSAFFQQEIGHWLRAGKYINAAVLIDSYAADLLRLGKLSFLIDTYRCLLSRVPDPYWQCKLTIDLGVFSLTSGDYAQARNDLENGRALAREQGEVELESVALISLYNWNVETGRFSEAQTVYDQWAAFHLSGPETARMQCAWLNNLAIAAMDLGDPEPALDYASQALALARLSGLADLEPECLSTVGNAYSLAGDTARAKEFFKQAFDLADLSGSQLDRAELLHSLAEAYLDEGQLQKALPACAQALAAAEPANSYRLLQECCFTLACAHLLLGSPEAARPFASRAAGYDIPLYNPARNALSGIIAAKRADPAAARAAFQTAIAQADELLGRCARNPAALYWRALAYHGMAQLQDSAAEAAFLQSYREAQAISASPGLVKRVQQLLEN